jgi:hypothetical protein
MMKVEDLKLLSSSESYGGNHSCHATVMLNSNKFDELPEEVRETIGYDAERFIEELRNKIELAHAKEFQQEKRQENIVKMQGLFHLAGFEFIHAEVIDNQYSEHPVYYADPWQVVTTTKGLFTIGWRKRVISIDWSKAYTKKTADELFPDEDVTKYDQLIHAWGYDKAVEYLTKLCESE